MAGTPMKRRVLAALQARATRDVGEGATIVDFASGFVAAGHSIGQLAELLASDLGHPVSRSFLSWTLNNIAPDSKIRLQAARREAPRAIQLAGRSECDERSPSGDECARNLTAA
jgi:hypothetical protein